MNNCVAKPGLITCREADIEWRPDVESDEELLEDGGRELPRKRRSVALPKTKGTWSAQEDKLLIR